MQNNQSRTPFEAPVPPKFNSTGAPNTPTKKGNSANVVILAIVAIAIIVLAITIIVILNNKEDEEKAKEDTTSSETAKEDDVDLSEDELALRKRDADRSDDLVRFITAVKKYQTNNKGYTPWSKGFTDTSFVHDYIDSECAVSDHSSYDRTCSEKFKDPNGKSYRFDYRGVLAVASSNIYDDKMTFEGNSNKIKVVMRAKCDGDNAVELETGEQSVVLAYKLESGKVVCVDNQ